MRRVLVVAALLAAVAVPRVVAAPQSDRELIGQLDREVIALQQKVRWLQEQVEGCGSGKGDPGPIYTELLQVFSGGPVQVQKQGPKVRVVLPADLLFSPSSFAIRQEADFAMDLLATALKLHGEATVTVIGHTDNDAPPSALRGKYPTNWELSTARANAVARALIDRYGLTPGRFTVAGRGDQEPVTGNDTPEGRATNRRVVVEIQTGSP